MQKSLLFVTQPNASTDTEAAVFNSETSSWFNLLLNQVVDPYAIDAAVGCKRQNVNFHFLGPGRTELVRRPLIDVHPKVE